MNQSRMLIATARERIARSRRRILASRLILQPIRGGSGGGPRSVSPIGLRSRIRRLLQEGEIPLLPDRRTWVGQGRGRPCQLCDQTITAAEWEREVAIADYGEIVVHGVCFRMWAEESDGLRMSA